MCSLPTPNASEVEKFRQLYENRFNVKLTDAEALDVCTKALMLYYVKHHASLGQDLDKERAPEFNPGP